MALMTFYFQEVRANGSKYCWCSNFQDREMFHRHIQGLNRNWNNDRYYYQEVPVSCVMKLFKVSYWVGGRKWPK